MNRRQVRVDEPFGGIVRTSLTSGQITSEGQVLNFLELQQDRSLPLSWVKVKSR